MPYPLDPVTVRRWCSLGRAALRAECARMDAINVFPVADGDTGTNLCLTFEAAAEAGTGEGSGGPGGAGDEAAGVRVLRAMARAALLEARGNSGTILAEYLRGMAEGLAEAVAAGPGDRLAPVLRRAAQAAYAAVARPVEGTVLTVATAAADAAEAGRDPLAAARAALDATTGRLSALSRAGVVDAGALGLVALLSALDAALTGEAGPTAPGGRAAPEPVACAAVPRPAAPPPGPEPCFEVMYLLEGADAAAVDVLRDALDALGDSLVIGGGDGGGSVGGDGVDGGDGAALWSVHVHVHDAGAAVEAGLAAGRPRRIRIAYLPVRPAADCAPDGTGGPGETGAARTAGQGTRAVVAVVPGDGLAGLCREAGAHVVPAHEAGRAGALLEAADASGAAEVVLLPNGTEFQAAAARAAEGARSRGVRAAVIPTRAAVQGLAALAVHAPERRFDEDVVAMTSAAGATRYGEVTVAARESWTTAGVCQAGDVLGLVDGDIAVIGRGVGDVAAEVLDRMLAGGGELVTLVLGEGAPAGLAGALRSHVRARHLAVDTVVYEGQRQDALLLLGVE
ncbi:DAK2 domain-containing protein [Streptomyces cacaoi]|uniref:DAK2 domain-containing protein n=1 Tax=Streptomyces cacaoi TaxID=1898 RepID=UPI00374A56AF